MQSYWIKFEDGSGGCCQGQNEFDAASIAEHISGKKVKDGEEFKYQAEKNPNIKTLPYPANPIIWQFEHPVHGKTPTFCHRPTQCAGHTACPQSYSCTE